ncbi:GIY-YIG nuclease family protein [Vibrio metschnikovii]|nr:GIY-YIG nuclease family protein [Vibrio metschnikovii]
MGFIYILKPNKEDPTIKIGRTKNLTERIKQHKAIWPSLKLIGYTSVNDEVRFEKVILDTLKPYQIGNKEQFILSKEDYQSVKRNISIWLIENNSPGVLAHVDSCQCFGPDGNHSYIIPPNWENQGADIHSLILKSL